MSSAIADFNNIVNSALNPLVENQAISSLLKLFLILYGSLAAPKLPVSLAPVFGNSFFRIGVMALIIWVANKDPAMAILIAVAYFVSMSYLVKNGVDIAKKAGYITSELSAVISGASGPSVKPTSLVNAEAAIMQQSVSSKTSGMIPDSSMIPSSETSKKDYAVTPEAVISGPSSRASVAGVPSIPSGNLASNPSMMASDSNKGENVAPEAFMSALVTNLAVVGEDDD